MPEWLSKNWDRILAVVLSSVVAGLIGFFSAMRMVDDQLGMLRERVAKLEVAKEHFERDRVKIGNNATAIQNLTSRHDSMTDRVVLSETRVATIKELTELQRGNTVNELKELLEQYGGEQ